MSIVYSKRFSIEISLSPEEYKDRENPLLKLRLAIIIDINCKQSHQASYTSTTQTSISYPSEPLSASIITLDQIAKCVPAP